MTTALVGYYDYDALRLRYRASVAPDSLHAYVVYELPNQPGVAYRDDVTQITSFTTDRTEVTTEADPTGGGGGGSPGCNITGGGVFMRAGATTLRRGAFYVRFAIARVSSVLEDCLCCGYVYDAKPFLSVGEHVEPGPSGGEGVLTIETIKADSAPAASTTFTPGVANTFRRVYGFAWYYQASADVASRTLQISARRPWGAGPTGFTDDTRQNVWANSSLTLTASEGGGHFVYNPGARDGFAVLNDNGTLSYASAASAPTPFPFDVRGDDPLRFLFVVGSGHANDRDTMYALYEEWLMP